MQQEFQFPVELLTASRDEKLAYFINCTVVHRYLKHAFDDFLDAVNNPGGASLILLFGPTGVGKTTLLQQVVRVILEENQASMMLNPAHIPVASTEARSPSSGSFDWKDYYRNVLISVGEPFANYKVRTRSSRIYGTGSQQIITKVQPNLADLRADVEYIFKQRRLIVFLIDEAQRFTKTTTGKQQKDQMDAIQSMASFTATRHGLFGTYGLLKFRNLSGQLSRRSFDIHFPRYQSDNPEDVRDFKRVLKSFALSMPLQETPDLEKYWEYFYERSIGCVGIVKDWLTQAFRKALFESSSVLKEEYLNRYAPLASKSLQMLNEATEGEDSLKDSEHDVEKLRKKLGLTVNKEKKIVPETQSLHQNLSNTGNTKSHKKKPRPGERNPERDVIGGEENVR
jgi:GTPase SAR1 family protein